MTAGSPRSSQLERWLAVLLQYGSWIASATIVVGFAVAVSEPLSGSRLETFGVVLFILLPALRVFLMLVTYIRESDYRLATAAALVLTVILLGLAIGVRTKSGMAG